MTTIKQLQIMIAGWPTDTAQQIYLPIDGIMGAATIAALQRFQKAYKIPITGVLDAKTEAVFNTLRTPDTSTAHFRWSDFWSPDDRFDGGKVPALEVKRNILYLMWKLEALRKKLGDKPVIITSGFRSMVYNKGLKGAAQNSEHMYGVAADVYVPGVANAVVANSAKTCGFSGIINYPAPDNHTHVDSRAEYNYGPTAFYWP